MEFIAGLQSRAVPARVRPAAPADLHVGRRARALPAVVVRAPGRRGRGRRHPRRRPPGGGPPRARHARGVRRRPSMTGGFTTVWTDDATAMASRVAHLVELGHRRFGRVAGPARSQPHPGAGPRLPARRSPPHGPVRHDRARRLLRRRRSARDPRACGSQPEPPTAIVFDNDLMAIAGLSTLAELGVSVPARGQPAGLGRLRAVHDHPPEAVGPEPRRDGVRRARRSAAVRPARRRRARRASRLHPGAGGTREHRTSPALTAQPAGPGRSGGRPVPVVRRPAAPASGTRPPAVATGKTTTATNGMASSRKQGTEKPSTRQRRRCMAARR